MSLGKSTLHDASVKQKINTGSSTHAELVGLSDELPKILWVRYFMEHQGYDVQDVCVHQDNENAILLETNGRKSAGKSSRHIIIKYFLVADSINTKELKVLHCPT